MTSRPRPFGRGHWKHHLQCAPHRIPIIYLLLQLLYLRPLTHSGHLPHIHAQFLHNSSISHLGWDIRHHQLFLRDTPHLSQTLVHRTDDLQQHIGSINFTPSTSALPARTGISCMRGFMAHAIRGRQPSLQPWQRGRPSVPGLCKLVAPSLLLPKGDTVGGDHWQTLLLYLDPAPRHPSTWIYGNRNHECNYNGLRTLPNGKRLDQHRHLRTLGKCILAGSNLLGWLKRLHLFGEPQCHVLGWSKNLHLHLASEQLLSHAIVSGDV